MTTLFVIWGISGAITATLLFIAWKKERTMGFTAFPSVTLSRIVWEELMLGKQALSRGALAVRPHALRLAYSGGRVLSRGNEFLVRRIYGKIKIEKGLTPSFFLKQIAEHRDERREVDRNV